MADSAIEKALAPGNSSNSTIDETAQKFALEVSLLTGGVAEGVWARVKECVAEPVQNALPVGATTVITGGISYALQRFSMTRLEACTELVLIAAGLYEGIRVAAITAGAARDTWRSPSTYKQNKKLIADDLGKPLFDLALYSAAAAGAHWKGGEPRRLSRFYSDTPFELQATRSSTATHFPLLVDDQTAIYGHHIEQIRLSKNPQLAELYTKNAPSIVQIHDGNIGQPKPSALDHTPWFGQTTFHGTGFIVDNDLIATNNHVICGEATKAVKVKLSTGEVVDAKLVARDKGADLALLQVAAGALKAKPLELGSTSLLSENSPLYAIGHPFGVSRPTASSGVLYNKSAIKFRHSTQGLIDPNPAIESFGQRIVLDGQRRLQPIERPTDPSPIMRQEVLNSTVSEYQGGSGSPVFDPTGRVVSVHSHRGVYSGGTTVEHLKALIEVHKANHIPGTWLNVITHAEPRPVLKDIVLDSINSARVDILNISRFGPRRVPKKIVAVSLAPD